MPSRPVVKAALALAVCAAVVPPGRASYTYTSLEPPPPVTAASAAALVLGHATVAYGHLGPPAGPFALAGWLYARPTPAAGGLDAAPFTDNENPAAQALKSAIRTAGLGLPGRVGTPGAGSPAAGAPSAPAHAVAPSGLAAPQEGTAGTGSLGDAGSPGPSLATPPWHVTPPPVGLEMLSPGAEAPGGPTGGPGPGGVPSLTPPLLNPVLIPPDPGPTAAGAGELGAAAGLLTPGAMPVPEPGGPALLLTALASLALYASRAACGARARGPAAAPPVA